MELDLLTCVCSLKCCLENKDCFLSLRTRKKFQQLSNHFYLQSSYIEKKGPTALDTLIQNIVYLSDLRE